MSDVQEHPPLARTSSHPARRVSAIWIIPIVAIAIGAWLGWDALSREGPTITVQFDSAEGLTANQSQLKYKNIVFGTVRRFRLTPDRSHVLVTIATTRQAKPLLTQGAQFWVVKPRLFAGELTGIGTLLSGSYVGMLPAAASGPAETSFVGREQPPVLQANVAGRSFLLHASRLGSISLGSPVYFRDLEVGQVLGWDIGHMANDVTIHIFVRAPFDGYVHEDTRFWDASGVTVRLVDGGVHMQLASLRALLLGGIAFTTPEESGSRLSPADHVFPLFADYEAAISATYSVKVPMVSYFSGPVSGLGVGSPVTVHGQLIGHVRKVELIYDAVKGSVLAQVRYDIEPERVFDSGKQLPYPTPREAIEHMLGLGLHAKLVTASLITGQQGIALDFDHDLPPGQFVLKDSAFVIPAIESGGLGDLTASANALLTKVNEIPFGKIGKDLDAILASVDSVTTDPKAKRAVTDLAATLAGTNQLIENLNRGLGPAVKQFPPLVAELQRSLARFTTLAGSLDNAYGQNTHFNRELERSLAQLNDALSSIRQLSDLLARHPEALVRGRQGGGLQ